MCTHTCEPFLLCPNFRKAAVASRCFGPQRMSSYCGFGAPEQLGEFMVSAKKRRSLSFCQSWFPSRFKWRPLWAAKGGHGPQPRILGDVPEPCSDSVFTSSNYILLLSNLSQNMLAVFDAWQHKQFISRKEALMGMQRFGSVHTSYYEQTHTGRRCLQASSRLPLYSGDFIVTTVLT